jgi:thymidylate synthase (FAD)
MEMQPERWRGPRVAALDEILGVPFKVLDDGMVRVVDYMGDDAAIVQAARVSYGAGTKAVSDDRGLIRYLLRHRHTTPFEMCELKLHVRVPMDAWRQWIRHRMASVNETSSRYSVVTDSGPAHRPGCVAPAERGQSAGQRRVCGHVGRRAVLRRRARVPGACPPRLRGSAWRPDWPANSPRKDLPLCTYTEAYWKIDLHNLLHFLPCAWTRTPRRRSATMRR